MRKLLIVLSLFGLACASVPPVHSEEYSHYYSVARDEAGDVLPSATIAVYLAGTTDLVPLYQDMVGTVKANPFGTDSVGAYSFYVEPGLYKISVTDVSGGFTVDNIAIGTQSHSERHASGGEDELLLSDLAGEVTSDQIGDGEIVNADIDAAAAIAESKLALTYPTHSNASDPSVTQKEALAGTAGLPNNTNRYVTNSDTRLTNARTPTIHAESHELGGSDELEIDYSMLVNLPSEFAPELHATDHENGGGDEISVEGLSGELADPQKVSVEEGGVAVANSTTINFVSGTDMDVSVVDNAGVIDVTVSSTSPGSALTVSEGISPVSTNTNSIVFQSTGFDLTNSASNESTVSLDLSEITVSADELKGIPLPSGTPNNGESLVYNDVSEEWELGAATSLDLLEESVPVSTVSEIDFQEGFDISGSSVSLDLTEITVNAATVNSVDFDFDPPVNNSLLLYNSSTVSLGTLRAFELGGTPADLMGLEFRFGDGFTVTNISTDYTLVELDPNEYTAGFNATSLDGEPIDLTTSPPDLGDTLKYNGTKFVPEPAAAATMYVNGEVTDEIAFSSPIIVQSDPEQTQVSIGTDSINDLHIDWGTGAFEVSADDIPDGETKVLLTDAEREGLTGGGNAGSLHIHSFSSLAGSYTAAQLEPGNTFSDSQVSDTLTIGSSSNVSATALTSGTIPAARLGNTRTETKSLIVPYPGAAVNQTSGDLYIPYGATVTRVSSKVRGTGTCNINIQVNGANILASHLSATTSGTTTTTITTPAISAGQWLSFLWGSCTTTVTEVTINVAFAVTP